MKSSEKAFVLQNVLPELQRGEKNWEIRDLKTELVREQRRFIYKKIVRSKQLMFGMVVIVILTLGAIFAPYITKFSPYAAEVNDRLQGPSIVHPFGTDALGRDLFSQVLYGARIALQVGASVGVVSGIAGMLIGLYASCNTILDNILMRICDGLRAIPSTMLAITLMSVLGANIWNVIISLTIVNTPRIARMSRSAALLVMEQTYIEAMRAQGAGSTRILLLHVAPNITSVMLVQMTSVIAGTIMAEAGLSFIGAGMPPSVPSWGSILSAGRAQIYNSWWMVLFPGIVIAFTVLGLNMIGDGLRDILDPKTN